MVTDEEIARGVERVLREEEEEEGGGSTTLTLNGVVKKVEERLGTDLSHKASFIRDHISLHFLRQQLNHHIPPSSSSSQPLTPPMRKDHFALRHQQYHFLPTEQHNSHFALQQQHFYHAPTADRKPLNKSKDSVPARTKRKGGAGGLNKVCSVSPELQAIVGEPTLSRTEIVKALWVYIRKNNLQDPSNKRKIICDDALRLVFETDATDMFKMNKLLSKHISPLAPTNETSQSKKLKVDDDSVSESSQSGPPTVRISEALAKFFGTEEREMLQLEAMRRVWEYIKANQLEDPVNSMAILCDEKLQELVGCESISALGMSELLVSRHLIKH